MPTKPQITATIKFRDVTIENMTLQELKELRDVLNEVVGEPPKTVERVIERHDHIYPWRYYYPGTTWAVSGDSVGTNRISLGNTSGGQYSTSGQHLTISCN